MRVLVTHKLIPVLGKLTNRPSLVFLSTWAGGCRRRHADVAVTVGMGIVGMLLVWG